MFIKITSAPPRCSVSTPSSSAVLKSSGSILLIASRVHLYHQIGFSSANSLAIPYRVLGGHPRLTSDTTLTATEGGSCEGGLAGPGRPKVHRRQHEPVPTAAIVNRRSSDHASATS
jgi:hypothetical protein